MLSSEYVGPKTKSDRGFLAPDAVTDLEWATVGRLRGNARNATKTNVVAISSLKHLNGVLLGNVRAWLDQGGAL